MAAAVQHQQKHSQLQDASSCLSFLKRKPSDQLNTDTKLPSVAYYRTRHKTTGARG